MKKLLAVLGISLSCCISSWAAELPEAALKSLQGVVNGEQRAPENQARDGYRHPVETLTFFGIEPGMTVVEIWPGTGWYTEILAPWLKPEGIYYAAHFSPAAGSEQFSQFRATFEQKLTADPENYSAVRVVSFYPAGNELEVPENSADRVLTFRNVHNWLWDDSEQQAFNLFFKALKPGGVLGVVEHRSLPGASKETMLKTGYMNPDYVIELAKNAGFVFDGSSEINANPKDTKQHPEGVWTLPPRLKLGEQDKEQYLAIGESDRMTLRFVKPMVAEPAKP